MNKLSPDQLISAIGACPTGTTIFCHNPGHLITSVIRLGLNSYWDHTATLVWYTDGEQKIPYIVEAKGGEKIYPKLFVDWVQDRTDNHFGISPAVVSHQRIESQYNKTYDYKAAIFYMVIYRLTNTWIGPTGDKAQETWFCFELSAWYRGLDEWWDKTPKDIIATKPA